jgi:transposase
VSQRIYRYTHYGLVLDRDLNAILNIFGVVREIGWEPFEYTSVIKQPTIQLQLDEQVASMIHEASLLVGR